MNPTCKIICALFFFFGFFGLMGQSEQVNSATGTSDTLSYGDQLYKEAIEAEKAMNWEEAVMKFDSASMFFLEQGDTATFEDLSYDIVEVCAKYKPKTWVKYLEGKLAFCKDYFGEESGQVGLYYQLLGELGIHDQLFQLDSSEQYLHISLEIFKKNENREPEAHRSLFLLATHYLATQKAGKAETAYLECLEILEKIYEKDLISENKYQVDKALHYLNIGLARKQLANNLEAIKYFKLSEEILATKEAYLEKNNSDFQARTWFSMGQSFQNLGMLNKAADYYSKASALFEKLRGPKEYYVGVCEYSFGSISEYKSEYKKALVAYEKALEIFIYNSGKESYGANRMLLHIGIAHQNLGDMAKAEQYYREAVKGFEKAEGFPGSLADSYYCLGEVMMKKKERLDSVHVYFKRTLELRLELYGERNPYTADIYGEIGNTYFAENDFKNAAENFQKAMVANSYLFNSLDFAKNPDIEDIIDQDRIFFYIECKIRLLGSLWSQNKESDEIFPQIQSLLAMADQLQKNKIMKIGDQPYQFNNSSNATPRYVADEVIARCHSFYQHRKDPEYITAYYHWMEKIKSQQLLSATRKSEAFKFGGIPEHLINKNKLLAQKIDSLEKVVYQAMDNLDTASAKNIRNGVLFEAKRNQEALISDWEKNYPQYFQLKYEFEPVKLKRIQELLDPKTLFIEFSISSEDKFNSSGGIEDAKIFYLALTNNHQETIRGDLSNDYQEKINTFTSLLRSHNLFRGDRRRKFINLSHELYQQFIQPIEHLLEGKERLVIVGEGITHYMPFETLLKSNDDKPWNELDFLVRDYEVSYHYSGTLFARAHAQKAEFDNELLAFAPIFKTENNPSLSALRASGLLMADSIYRSVEGDNFSPLPHSEKEVNNISQMFPNISNVKLLTNLNADESSLKSALEQNYRFVHIASHSFANMDHPKFSGIACASSSTENEKEDGILYVGEIYNLDVNSDLVILSSCESGVGKLLSGEGMLGLNRSFVYAGVPNVIYSLWKVFDESTSEMMTEFYKNTLQGQSYSSALRTAKLKMLEDPITAAPDIWSAFLLVGR